jgi:SM-20-related protein
MNNAFDTLINSYLEHNIGIDSNFLTTTLANGLTQNILQLQQNEQMQHANIGNEIIKDTTQKIRSDKIYWMDKSHNNPFENEFLLLVEHFIDYLNRTCYTGINACEFHYAVYEEGTYYKRHKDQFQNNSNRKYSLISYLNQNWQDADGGQLLVYQNDTVQKIQPQSQTAVFFKSSETEHEVALAHRERMSITGWLKQV